MRQFSLIAVFAVLVVASGCSMKAGKEGFQMGILGKETNFSLPGQNNSKPDVKVAGADHYLDQHPNELRAYWQDGGRVAERNVLPKGAISQADFQHQRDIDRAALTKAIATCDRQIQVYTGANNLASGQNAKASTELERYNEARAFFEKSIVWVDSLTFADCSNGYDIRVAAGKTPTGPIVAGSK